MGIKGYAAYFGFQPDEQSSFELHTSHLCSVENKYVPKIKLK